MNKLFIKIFIILLSIGYSNSTLNLNVTNVYGDPLENVYVEVLIDNFENEGIGKTDISGNFIFKIENK